ncbi:hypothetical protein PKHYL_30350 [Psychrobacter sp. KH172YL61]|nr:hypothetical protein PKHYL_30350 [Psychrobacter sp. KH172YL61]
MKFLFIASYPASILRFRGALIAAIKDTGFEVHVVAPDFGAYPDEHQVLKDLGYYVHDITMQRTGTKSQKRLKNHY